MVDHLSAMGLETTRQGFTEPLLGSLGADAPDMWFVDSFELLGELPWSNAFAEAFERSHGYSVLPHLASVIRDAGEVKYTELLGASDALRFDTEYGVRVREDYASTRAELFETFVGGLSHLGLPLRLQAHGGWGDVLDGYALADVPESEQLYGDGSYDMLKLASSAAHVMGAPHASCETLIAITGDPDAIRESEVRLLAGRALAAGLDQLVFHGFPAPATQPDGTPWFPFAQGAEGQVFPAMTTWFREDSPLWKSLPRLTTWVGRLSYAIQQGEPHADVAWLHPEREVKDATRFHFDGFEAWGSESAMSLGLRNRGLSYDRVSRSMLAGATADRGRVRIGAMTYGAVLWPEVEAVDPVLLESLSTLVDAGVPVIRWSALPSRATGWRDADARDARVLSEAAALATQIPRVEPEDVADFLVNTGLGVLVPPASGSQLDLLYRRLEGGWLVLAVNEHDVPVRERMHPRSAPTSVEQWDPSTSSSGRVLALDESGGFEMVVPARDARVFVWTCTTADGLDCSRAL